MRYLTTIAILILLLNSLCGQIETMFSLGLLNYGLSIDNSGSGYGGTFNEDSKNTIWGAVKASPWSQRFPINVELRFKYKNGSMSSSYGGQAFPSYTEIDYKQIRVSSEFRYKFKLFKTKSIFTELGCFFDTPLYSKIKGSDGGERLSYSGKEIIKRFDFGISGVLGVKHMFNQYFGINLHLFTNQSVRWNWHHNLLPMRDLGIGLGVIWAFEKK
ncbi:MAG: hypothetical protein GC192_14745 [Bacteroidetes bacterium]|nr:hypothetical protein [Bacteroidota bacterium]